MNALRQIAARSMPVLARAHKRLGIVVKDESLHPIWRIWAAEWAGFFFKLHCIAFETAMRISRRA